MAMYISKIIYCLADVGALIKRRLLLFTDNTNGENHSDKKVTYIVAPKYSSCNSFKP